MQDMDRRIQPFLDRAKTMLGLDNYTLHHHSFERRVNLFLDTEYLLCMEWLPHLLTREEDGSNPEGTAIVEMDVQSCRMKSVIFVSGKTFAHHGVRFPRLDRKAVIHWLEQETGLIYGEQFQLHKQEGGTFHFTKCVDGIAVFPPGYLEIKLDPEGKLVHFVDHGPLPAGEMVKKETYSLSLEGLDKLARQQLKLVEYPSFEQKRFVSLYAIEEIFVANDQSKVIPYEPFQHEAFSVKIDKTIEWDEPAHQRFERQEICWHEGISAEQAFSCEPSPDALPISREEQAKCVSEVREVLRKEYPQDSGKWILKTLHRDKGYLYATLRLKEQDPCAIQRKLTILIHAKDLQAINYMDNKFMLDMLEPFQAPEKVAVAKDEAFEKIKKRLELTPYYVYDRNSKQYVLCGKLDCPYGVIASSGEVLALEDLQG